MIFVVTLFLVSSLIDRFQLQCAQQEGEGIDLKESSSHNKSHVKVVIAIGSAPKYQSRRDLIRQSWMQWNVPGITEIRFFTEETPDTQLEANNNNNDTVLAPSKGGYRGSTLRFFDQAEWFQERYDFDYFLRVDDDGFLCLPSLLQDLEQGNAPTANFFWGKYFCGTSVVADENFMLFSADLIQFFLASKRTLRINEKATFAANFGLWQHMMHLQVLDDRDRIDAQQGYLTEYMRKGNKVKDFCQSHIWAHHVTEPQVFKQVYQLAKHRGYGEAAPTNNNHTSTTNTSSSSSWIHNTLGKVCQNTQKHPECLNDKTTSLYSQEGSTRGFQGAKGFPSIVSNGKYPCH